MEFHVLDEVVEIEGKGLLLFVMTEDCPALYDGCTIRDSRGNEHIVTKIVPNEPLTSLYINDGDVNYFQRLFRDVRIDATLFSLLAEAGR